MTDPNPMLEAAATANAAMRADVAQTKLRLRGVGDLPLDREAATWEITEEQRALRNSRPRTRRWRSLEKHDQAVDRAKESQAVAGARLQDAEAALARAPEDDAHTLADWLAGGEKGARPQASVYERERDRDAAKLLVEAAMLEVDRALERRLQHVLGKRERMLEDARRDVESTSERLRAQVRALPELRQALVAARETLLWIASYPNQAPSFGFTAATALGLLEPMRRTLQTTARIDYAALLQVLEEDVTALAEAFSSEQKERLGVKVARSPISEAMWDDDPDHVAWKKSELERARRLAEWHIDPGAIASEIRDQRP